MDTIYEHPNGQNGPYGSPVVIYGSWPQWQQEMWTKMLMEYNYRPVAPPWIPTYDGPFYSKSEDGTLAILDPYETPNEATAVELMKRYRASRCIPRKFDGANGPNTSPAIVRWLEWDATGTSPIFGLKAGDLAEIHSRNANNPDVAKERCLAAIQTSRTNIPPPQVPPAT